jgi:hypothetical protein
MDTVINEYHCNTFLCSAKLLFITTVFHRALASCFSRKIE